MLARLKRPGYWILFLALISVYFYHRFQVEEKLQQREALLNLYRSYGQSVLSDLREKNFLALQNRFGEEGEKRIDLEKIALFIDTLHMEGEGNVQWDLIRGEDGNLTLSGKLTKEGNVSYPIDLFLARRGGKIILKQLRVGHRELAPSQPSFPLDTMQSAKAAQDENFTVLPVVQENETNQTAPSLPEENRSLRSSQ